MLQYECGVLPESVPMYHVWLKNALIACFFHIVFQNREDEMLPNGEANLSNHNQQEDEGNANAGAETGQFSRIQSKLFGVQINHAADI